VQASIMSISLVVIGLILSCTILLVGSQYMHICSHFFILYYMAVHVASHFLSMDLEYGPFSILLACQYFLRFSFKIKYGSN